MSSNSYKDFIKKIIEFVTISLVLIHIGSRLVHLEHLTGLYNYTMLLILLSITNQTSSVEKFRPTFPDGKENVR